MFITYPRLTKILEFNFSIGWSLISLSEAAGHMIKIYVFDK